MEPVNELERRSTEKQRCIVDTLQTGNEITGDLNNKEAAMTKFEQWCQYQMDLDAEDNSPEAIAAWQKIMDEAIALEDE